MFSNINFINPISSFIDENNTQGEKFSSYGTPWSVRPVIVKSFSENEDLIKLFCQRNYKCTNYKTSYLANGPSLPLFPPKDLLTQWPEKIYMKNLQLLCFRNKLKHHSTNKHVIVLKKYEEILKLCEDGQEKKALQNFKILEKSGLADELLNLAKEYTNIMASKHTSIRGVNPNFKGGCLSYINTNDDNKYLIYPILKNQVLKIAFHKTSLVRDKVELDEYPTEIEMTSLTSKWDVYQIEAVQNNQYTIAGIRKGQSCILLNKNEGIISEVKLSNCDLPTSFTLSNYIFGESLISTESGKIYHWIEEQQKPKKIFELSESDKIGYNFLSDFGSSPRILVVSSNSSLFQLDIREPCHKQSELFELSANGPHHDSIHISRHITNTYYHSIATKKYFYILDLRFPGQAVFTWRHSFLSPPLYMKIIPNISSSFLNDDVLILGSQNPGEVHCYQFHNLVDSSKDLPSVCGAPWIASRPIDAARHLSAMISNVILNKSVIDRFHSPLIGLTSFRPQQSSNNFSIVQMTAAGDIFIQDFAYELSELESEKTCCSGPSNHNLKLNKFDQITIRNWLDKICQLKNNDLTSCEISNWDTIQMDMMKKLYKNGRSILLKDNFFIDLNEMPIALKNCPICNLQFKDTDISSQIYSTAKNQLAFNDEVEPLMNEGSFEDDLFFTTHLVDDKLIDEHVISDMLNEECKQCLIKSMEAKKFVSLYNLEIFCNNERDVDSIFNSINEQLFNFKNVKLQQKRYKTYNKYSKSLYNKYLDKNNYLNENTVKDKINNFSINNVISLQELCNSLINTQIKNNEMDIDTHNLDETDKMDIDVPLLKINKNQNMIKKNCYISPVNLTNDNCEAGTFNAFNIIQKDSNLLLKHAHNLDDNRVDNLNNTENFDLMDCIADINTHSGMDEKNVTNQHNEFNVDLLDIDSQILLAQWNNEDFTHLVDKRHEDIIFIKCNDIYRKILRQQ